MEKKEHNSDNGGKQCFSKSSTDPMISILMEKDAINIISTLIAKMECITFDDGRTRVFRTTWGHGLFKECTRRLSGTPFDIDEWFRLKVNQAAASSSSSSNFRHHQPKVRRDIDPSLYQQTMETDWLSALLELELEFSQGTNFQRGSALRILHNIIKLEDSAIEKLSEYCKKEKQYNFEGVPKSAANSNVSYSKLLMPARQSPPPPTPDPIVRGSVDDMLKR